jgi:hypothetical protein
MSVTICDTMTIKKKNSKKIISNKEREKLAEKPNP